ncbi:reverse transcriptase domain-containing protein [Tanacetum coccineum]
MEDEEELNNPWTLFMDRSSCADGYGAGLVLINPEGMEFTYPLRFRFDATNNKAEYKALIARLKIAKQMGPRSVVAKALRIGYYWPTMHEDSRKLIQACQDCQVHKPLPRNPQQKLSPITSSWPFYKWGIDIARPFPKGPGKVKFLIVAIDYFTKWIKAKPVTAITGSQIKKSCGITLCADSDSQEKPSQITKSSSKTTHSRIGARNYISASISLLTEAVIPTEIGMPTLRTTEINLKENNKALEINLDLLEERREQAAIKENHEALEFSRPAGGKKRTGSDTRSNKSKEKMERYYNSKVRSVSLKPGDLVYRNNEASRAEDTGKLGPKWEVPYEVTKALGNQLPRTWNVSNLKKCYVHKM